MAAAEAAHPVRTWLVGAIAVVVLGWALRAMGPFVEPLIFALFLSLVIRPLNSWVAGHVPPKLGFLGHLAAMLVGLAAIVAITGCMWIAAMQVVDAMQSLRPGSRPGWWPDAQTGGEEAGFPERFEAAPRSASDNLGDRIRSFASTAALRVLERAGTALTTTILIFFLTLLMVVEGPLWRAKLSRLVGSGEEDKAVHAIDTVAGKLRAYIAA